MLGFSSGVKARGDQDPPAGPPFPPGASGVSRHCWGSPGVNPGFSFTRRRGGIGIPPRDPPFHQKCPEPRGMLGVARSESGLQLHSDGARWCSYSVDQAFGGGAPPGVGDQPFGQLDTNPGQAHRHPAETARVGRRREGLGVHRDEPRLVIQRRLDGDSGASWRAHGEDAIPDAEGELSPGLAFLGAWHGQAQAAKPVEGHAWTTAKLSLPRRRISAARTGMPRAAIIAALPTARKVSYASDVSR